MPKNVVQRVVVGAVIVNNQSQVLILQRSTKETTYPGMWELPSGKRENLEPTLDGLKREVSEETGLEIEPLMPFSVFDYQVERPEEIRDATQVNFLVKTSGKVVLSPEHDNFAWISVGDLENYNLTAAAKSTIRQAFGLLEKLR